MSVVAPMATKASENCLEIGTRLSDFEITGVLGEGGFGIVYLAFDHALQRTVAIKEYMPGVLAARGQDHSVSVRADRHQDTINVGLKSFINEARFLAQFDHPSLVKVYRYWEQNRTAYTAMKYYEGRTLKDIVLSEPGLATESWCRSVMRQILDALELLDSMNIVHRDVSPDNIIVQDNGQAVLLDFGSARQIIGDHARGLTVILKPGYAPVEQYAGDASLEQGAYTDIYALSAVMYFAIVGEAPATSIARMVKDPLVPLRERAPSGFTPAFLDAIDQGLAVLAAQRPQTIAAFRELLGIEGPAVPMVKPAGGALRVATVEHIGDTVEMTIVDPDQTIKFSPAGLDASAAATGGHERRGWLVPVAAGTAVLGLIGLAAHLLLSGPEEVMKPVVSAPVQAPVAAAPAAEPAPLVLHEPAPASAAPQAAAAAELQAERQAEQQADPLAALAATAEADEPATAQATPELVTYQLAIRPAGTIYVDGKKQGATPALKSLDLAPGKHRIKVVNKGFPDYVVAVNVKPGQPGTITHHFAASSLF
jgi:predicted Ser/Thr protein kinase